MTTTKSLHVLHAAVVPTSFNCSRSTFERMSMLSKLIHTCPHSNMNVVVAFFKNSLTSQVNNFTTSQLCTIHLCICNWCSKQIIDLKIWEFLLETQNWIWSLDYFWNSNRPNCKDIYWKIAPFNYEKISVTYHFILVCRDWYWHQKEIEDRLFNLCETMAPPPLLSQQQVRRL